MTLKVHLQRDWNAPGDNYYKRASSPIYVEDDLLPHLPSTAQLEVDGKKLTKLETRKKVLRERHAQGLDKPSNFTPKSVEVLDDKAIMAEIAAEDAKTPAPSPKTLGKAPTKDDDDK